MGIGDRFSLKPLRRFVAVMSLLTLGATACGSSGSGEQSLDSGAESSISAASNGQSSRIGLPSVEVTDVESAQPVALASLLPADRALLVWFWAPH